MNSINITPLEASIVEQAQNYDSDAISWLYQHYFQQVYRYIAVRIRQQSDVEDLTAQVFVTMLEKLPAYRGDGVFAAWLFRIAHNMVIDYLRSRKYKESRTAVIDDDTVEQIVDIGQDPEEIFQNKHLQEQLFTAMGELTDLQRQVIALRFVAHLSSSEIATIMGRKENAIYALQHAALASLQKILRKRGLDPSAK